MAGSQQVQDYLQKHKIGPLFEDMMARVISSQPDEPIIFLQHYLDRRAAKQGLRRSAADAEGLAVAKKQTTYDKPWLTNTKRLKPKKSEAEPGRGRPEWDPQTKAATTSFEDLWADGKTDKKKSGRSPSPTRRKTMTAAWAATTDADDEDLLYHSYGYCGPHRPKGDSEDPLAGEFSLSTTSETVTQVNSIPSSSKKGGQKADANRHKVELEKWLKEEQERRDSGIEEDKDLHHDDALELMENLDDLRSEGVTNVKRKIGFRISSSLRQRAAEPPVKVSICARCASVMAGGMPSEPVASGHYGELPTEDYPNSSRPQSARFSAIDSDEEIESVSQVTGPRHPVWQEDSDGDALTPRKGAHMFSAHGMPSKGRPMYSPDHALKKQQHSRGSPTKSQEHYKQSPTSGDPKGLAQSWSPAPGYDDSSEAPQKPPAEKEASPTKDDANSAVSGGGWHVADYDTDASTTYHTKAY